MEEGPNREMRHDINLISSKDEPRLLLVLGICHRASPSPRGCWAQNFELLLSRFVTFNLSIISNNVQTSRWLVSRKGHYTG